MALVNKIKHGFRISGDTGAHKYLMVPIFMFFALLIFALIRSPIIISPSGIGSIIILTAPLILATYALTIIVMAGRGGVDLSIGPFMGFINVSLISLYAHGYLQHPVSFFIYAIGIGVIYQVFFGIIVVFVRVQPIIIALAGYLAFTGINLVILSRPGGVAPDWIEPWGAGITIFNEILLLLILATIFFYLITHTAFWGHLKLMGADERAAFTSGVKINWVRIVAHGIAGIFAGLSAISFTALIGSGDPIQGTKYTLLGVTALVLGGASLVGGRGGAFGAILGALILYLINYTLVTFQFERLQSFVSDLSYGGVLVIALLISLTLPFVQRITKNLSVFVFFILMSIIGLAVIVHTTQDIPIAEEKVLTTKDYTGTQYERSTVVRKLDATGNIIVEGDASTTTGEGTAQGGSLAGHSIVIVKDPGTVVLYVILGLAGLAYLFTLLARNRDATTTCFALIVAVIVVGLIFDSDSKQSEPQVEQINLNSNQSTIENFSPQYFSLEKIDFFSNISSNSSLIVSSTYSLIYIVGTILLTSLIVMVMLPQFSTRAKATALLLFASASTIVLLGGISYYNLGDKVDSSLFGLQGYGIILVGLLLFVITAPFVHSNIANLTNIYIFGLSILAILAVYFLAGNTSMSTDPALYQSQIISELQIGDLSQVAYGEPARHFNPSISTVAQFAYSAVVIFLFQYFVFIAMSQENSFNRFAPFMYIVICAGFLWSAMFYAVGYPLYKIIVVLIIGLPITPLVWQFFGVYLKKIARDRQLSQWAEEREVK
jgi:ribose transport system permease protein